MTTRRLFKDKEKKIECMGEIIRRLIKLTNSRGAYKSGEYQGFMSSLGEIQRNVFTPGSLERYFSQILELKPSFTRENIIDIQTLVVKLIGHESLFPDIINPSNKSLEEYRLEISNKKIHREMLNLMLVVDNIDNNNLIWEQSENTGSDEPLFLIVAAFLTPHQKVQCMKQSVQRLNIFVTHCETEAKYTAFLTILKDVRDEVVKTTFTRQNINHIQNLVDQLYALVSMDCKTKTQRYLKIYTEVENLSKIVASIYKDAAELTQKYEARRVYVRMTGEWMKTDLLTEQYTSKLRNIQDYMHVQDHIAMVIGVLIRMPSLLASPAKHLRYSLIADALRTCIENLHVFPTNISEISDLLPPIDKFYIRQETGDSFNTHFDPKSKRIKETLLQLYPIFENIMLFMQQTDDGISNTLKENSWSTEGQEDWAFCKETVSNAKVCIDSFVHIENDRLYLEKKNLDLNLLLAQLEELALATS